MSPGFFLLAATVFVAAFVFIRWRSGRSIPVSGRKAASIKVQKTHKVQKTQRNQIKSISPQKEIELRELVKRGAKIQAIKQVHRWTNLGLQESKDYISSLSEIKQAPSLGNEIPSDLKDNLKNLVQRKQKIQAIKQLRTYTGWDLKKSKDYVDRL
jgi:ribosomal protein L7/L12